MSQSHAQTTAEPTYSFQENDHGPTEAVAMYLGDHIGERNRVERTTYCHDGGGRWYASAQNPDGSRSYVGVHQLTAIADGAEPSDVFADDTDVHHRNSIGFDNRGANLEVVDKSQHRRTHAEAAWEYDHELGCDALVTAEAADAEGGEADT